MPLHGLSIHTSPGQTRHRTGARTSAIATALSPTEWMVSDASTAIGNSSGVLGFIQFTAGTYEVTRIGGSVIEFSTVLTLAEAVTVLSTRPLRRLNLVVAPPRH